MVGRGQPFNSLQFLANQVPVCLDLPIRFLFSGFWRTESCPCDVWRRHPCRPALPRQELPQQECPSGGIYAEPFDRDVSLSGSLLPIAKEYVMNGIIYIVGLVVVIGLILSFLGLR